MNSAYEPMQILVSNQEGSQAIRFWSRQLTMMNKHARAPNRIRKLTEL
jgi:hypothetical protein